MITFLLNAASFVGANLRIILITAAVATVGYFIIGFFNLRAELSDTQHQLALSQAKALQLEKDIADSNQIRDDLAKQKAELDKKTADLVNQLNRNGKKSISELAIKHSKLIEKAINNGTEKALKCLEIVSRGGNC